MALGREGPQGGRNSGVFVHVIGPDKIWPKAIEAQLMADHAGDFWLVDNFKLKVDPKRQDPKVARHYFRMKDDVEKTSASGTSTRSPARATRSSS